MIAYPRWKIALVAIVVLLGIFLALPNLFGEESALQLAADRAAVTEADRTAVEQILKDKGVTPSGVFLEQGRLTLRFASTTDQLKARDLIAEARPKQFTIALSQASRVPGWMHQMGMAPVKLGLDLRGGVYLVYQVDVQGAVKQLLDRREQDFRASLRTARAAYQDVVVDYPQSHVRVLFRDADALAKGKAAILADARNLNLNEITVGGAPALELQLTPQEIKERQDYAVSQNIVILRNRLNSPELAVSEPQVAREGVDRIAIQLPGLQNSAEVKKILGKTATLEFRMVDETNNPLEAASTGRVPLGSKLYYTREKQPVLLKRDVVVTGDQLTDATFQPNSQDGPAVSVGLDSRGAAKMLKNTQENLGHLMAVVFIDRSREKNAQGVEVDRTTEEVINRATIRGVFANNFQITGVNPIEGRELALLLRAGGLGGAADAGGGTRHWTEPGPGQHRQGHQGHGLRHGGRVPLYAHLLQGVRVDRGHRARGQRGAADGVAVRVRRGADLAGHCRGGVDRRHGGGREHSDLRAHSRGIAQRRHAAGGDRRRFRAGAVRDHGLERHGADRRRRAVVVRRRRDPRLRGRAGARHLHLGIHLGDGQPRPGAGHLRRQAQARPSVDLRVDEG